MSIFSWQGLYGVYKSIWQTGRPHLVATSRKMALMFCLSWGCLVWICSDLRWLRCPWNKWTTFLVESTSPNGGLTNWKMKYDLEIPWTIHIYKMVQNNNMFGKKCCVWNFCWDRGLRESEEKPLPLPCKFTLKWVVSHKKTTKFGNCWIFTSKHGC